MTSRKSLRSSRLQTLIFGGTTGNTSAAHRLQSSLMQLKCTLKNLVTQKHNSSHYQLMGILINTFKTLVGITPSGSVCFISDLYGGCIFDKEITSKPGFIDKLQQGDKVMADCGFNI